MAVDHVEPLATGATAELGATLALRVRVHLVEPAPDDMEVQAIARQVNARNHNIRATPVPLKPVGGADQEGRWMYEGRSRWTGRGRSGTRYGSSRRIDSWSTEPG